MNNKLLGFIAGMICMAFSVPAHAIPFSVVEDNSPIDLTGQLQLDVTDGGSGKTLFTFKNSGNNLSTITDIYFDWGTPLTFDSFASTGNVSFSVDAHPNFPGGQNISFSADWGSGANHPSGTGHNGIDNYNGTGAQDTLTIAFTGSSFNTITSALNDDNLRIGLHLQGLADGKSETYVTDPGTNPVPEPATMLLFGTGLAGAAGYTRRKRGRSQR